MLAVIQRSAFAQLVVEAYPVNLSQYVQQLSLQCPAAIVAANKWETSISSRRNIGFWRNNQTYFAQGAFRIQKDEKSNFHGLGLAMYYDKEGAYLKRYRGYLLYAYHLKLNKKYTLSGGISLGLMSYQVGNANYDGGTASGFDGTLGFMFYGNAFYLSASIAQLPQSKVQPIDEITVLSRYYQFLIGKNFRLNNDLLLKTNLNAKFYFSKDHDIYGQAGILWNESLGLYGSYKLKGPAAVILGIEKIELDDMQLRAYFSYDIPLNGDVRYQAFEITLQCVRPEKKTNSTTTGKKKKQK